jgi:mannose-1-phosphate guanylyltransferase/mannose-6-phosphate isomerase
MVSERPWGRFEVIRVTEGYQVKRLSVDPGGRLSLQRHRHRSEHWVVVNGLAHVTRGPHEFTLHPNESVFIPAGAKHRLENHSASEPLEVIEVQVGGYLGEDDIERFEDDYQRA